MANSEQGSDAAYWTIPIATFLVSAGWWENYVDRRSPLGKLDYIDCLYAFPILLFECLIFLYVFYEYGLIFKA